LIVFMYEFKVGVNAYLADLAPGARVRTLEEIIDFNKRNAAENLPYFGQEWLERSQAKGALTETEYVEALEKCRRLGGREGLDAAMDQNRLDALVAPTTTRPGLSTWSTATRSAAAARRARRSPAIRSSAFPRTPRRVFPWESRSWVAPGASPPSSSSPTRSSR